MRRMTENTSEFVQLVREFLLAHASLEQLFSEFAPDAIPFPDLGELADDNERSVLYRLKEHSHALFRDDVPGASEAVRRESLFDLAIGSLFHEAMKLRESLYQCEVYGPRVDALRDIGVDEEGEVLLAEFERIVARSRSRVYEVVAEVRVLLAQTRDQLRRLLIDRAGECLVTRFLLGRREEVERTFPEGLDGLLAAMHGTTVAGLVVAARSLLESAYFVEAARALAEAADRPGAAQSEIRRLRYYADGMQAFLDGEYEASLTALEAWNESVVDEAEHEAEHDFARLAASALGRLPRLMESDAVGREIATRAKRLQGRLGADSA